MDGLIMSAFSLLVGSILAALFCVLFDIQARKAKSQEQALPCRKQTQTRESLAPLNRLAHSEINEILGRCGGEEQLL